jgi:hypothetical protein
MKLVRFLYHRDIVQCKSQISDNFASAYNHPQGDEYEGAIALRTESYSTLSGATGIKHNGINSITSASTSLDDVNDNSGFYGPEGFSRYRPRKPVIGLGQALAEVRELPRMFKDAYDLLTDIKNIDSLDGLYEFLSDTSTTGPSSYVALQFGWKPFIKDVTDGLRLRENTHNAWNQAVRDHDKSVRRQGVLKHESEITSVTQSKSTSQMRARMTDLTPLIGGGGNGGYSFLINKNTHIEFEPGTQKFVLSADSLHDVWFSARFKTFFPPLQRSYVQSFAEIGAYLDLWGLSITPKLLYDLVPWSWLVDWTSNLGSIIDNYSNDDSVVAEYAYVMEHTATVYSSSIKLRGTRYFYGDGTYRTDNRGLTLKSKLICESKLRTEASPYGFALDPSSFSARQWSILGSLGLLKSLKPTYNP